MHLDFFMHLNELNKMVHPLLVEIDNTVKSIMIISSNKLKCVLSLGGCESFPIML